MKRFAVRGAAFTVAGAVTIAVLVLLAVTDIWDVSKGASFGLPLIVGLVAAFSVGRKEPSEDANKA